MNQPIQASRSDTGLFVTYTAPASYKGDGDENEDALFTCELDDQTVVLAVADGAGGHPAGHEASALVVSCLEDAVHGNTAESMSLREPILTSLETANRLLLEKARGSLTTAAIVEIQQNTMRPYHVGDSSILVVGQRGVVKYQSVSHSTVGLGIEAGLMEADAAHQHEERHWVLNFVGTAEMRIEVGAPLQLARFDTLLVCSDAITDNLPMPEVCEIIRKGALEKAISKLVQRCHEAMNASEGRPDDMSVILYRRAG